MYELGFRESITSSTLCVLPGTSLTLVKFNHYKCILPVHCKLSYKGGERLAR